MAIATTKTRLSGDVLNGATFLAPYPVGHNRSTIYIPAAHVISDESGNVYSGVTVINTGAAISVINSCGRTLLAGSLLTVQLTGYVAAAKSDLFNPVTNKWLGKLDLLGNEQGIFSTDERAEFLAARSEGVQRPYRLVTYGDSRSTTLSPATTLTPTGSGLYCSSVRSVIWMVGILGDVEIVANYGHGGDLATAWASSSRPNLKTINNLISGRYFKGGLPDVAFVQYGINDYIGGSSGATVAASIQALCSALMGAGMKVILEATNPASAANYGASAAAKLAATIDGNARLKDWAAGFPNQLVFVDTFSSLVDATGYASATYIADGTHLNTRGAMLAGAVCAQAARTLLPVKRALIYTCGSLLQPNLIDWSAMASGSTLFGVSAIGTVTFNTPTWNYDPTLGMPYAEVTMTCGALAGGYAQARFEVHASTVSGGSPRFPISVGDELQGSAYITVDDGAGGAAPIQAVSLRHRLYSDTKFADDGLMLGAAGDTFTSPVARRFMTPTFVTATASAGISAPASGAGYSLQAQIEFNTVGQSARVRVYAPSLRVVSVGGAQPTQPAAGASPYTYTNTTGSPVTLYVAGGTVSAISIARQGTALVTGFTAGAFRLSQNDSVTITYTVAPTLTLVPEEQI